MFCKIFINRKLLRHIELGIGLNQSCGTDALGSPVLRGRGRPLLHESSELTGNGFGRPRAALPQMQ